MNIPIYRAKKIDSEEWVEGYLKIHKYNNRTEYIINYTYDNATIFGECEVDQSTLAIHFPDMLDSEGNKIFASLSEDGRGGDYTSHHDLPVIFLWDSLNACICLKGKYEYTSLFKDGSTHKNISTFNNYKIIGIQK